MDMVPSLCVGGNWLIVCMCCYKEVLKKGAMHTHKHTASCTYSYTQPRAVTIPPVHLLTCLQLCLPSQLLPECWREKDPTCHFRYAASTKACPDHLAKMGSVSVWGDRGCHQECERQLWDITIHFWMRCELDSRKHLGACTCRSSLVTFLSPLWHVIQTFTTATIKVIFIVNSTISTGQIEVFSTVRLRMNVLVS